MATVDERALSASAAEGLEAKKVPGRVRGRAGMQVPRIFSREGVSPFDEVDWELRGAEIKDERGRMIFQQVDCEIPRTWSQLATNVVASKYFYGDVASGNGSPADGKREYSVRQLIDRVTRTIADWGKADGYFATAADAERFYDELTALCLHQYGSFNSPVWFNVGLFHRYGIVGPANNYRWDEEARAVTRAPSAYEYPQASACFIQSVSDDMEGIMRLATSEAMLFKFGSGTGTDLSTLRSSREKLSGGGRPSGPVSFMRVYDAVASVVKSGGKTRRAAKMQTLKCWHPDILEFIECKTNEEKKAQALIRAGYEANFNGAAYSSVMFQNANLSVRCTDAFLRAAEADADWTTRAVTTGRPMQTYKAGMLLDKIAEGTWLCGDPGVQYEDTIQRWHTCPNTAPINSSNPCVTGETLVSTAEGYRRIADLVGRETILVDRHGVRRPVDKIFPTGRKPVYRLTTAAGYQLRLTADHRVFTVNRGDVPACELKKDDRIALNPVGFGDDDLDVGIAEIIGLMLGDGCIWRSPRDGEPISMLATGSSLEAPIVAEVRDRLNRFEDGYADGRTVRSIEAGEGGIATVTRPRTGSRAVAEVFERYAVLDRGPAGKRLTDAVFGLSRASVAGLLRGLFTADGCVYNYGAKSQSIVLDSVSLELLRQVQLLLLGFGIKAKLYTDRRVGPLVSMMPDGKGGVEEYPVQQVHSLRISRSSRVRFEKEVGFWPGSAKQAKLELLNQAVATYADRMDDPVASVVYEGEEDVFDLTEPATGHFGANGLVVHNCSEYMFIDDSACNLASINLMKFRREDGGFDVERFRAAVRIFITAQEILVDHASYPTDRIAANSHKFRPLGLGYANLGSLIMASGLPYDSDRGRGLAGAITAIMHGQAYLTSAEHAAHVGPFEGFAVNREPMLRVMEMHRDAIESIDPSAPAELLDAARSVWTECLEMGREHGYRNSQVTVLAPTGTIAFMMDCDTTGIEPDIALVKYKQLAGGGMLKIVNRTVPMALEKLGYAEPEIRGILDYIDANDTIEGAPGLREEDLPVFDCAFAPPQGGRSIHYRGHLGMMAAVQPFLSGAISKCVVGETLIATADGLVRIGTLHGGERPDTFRDERIGVASLGGRRTTDAFYYGGTRPVREVVLRSGHRVVGTPNHRLLVAAAGDLRWKRLDELVPGDYVATQYGTDLWAESPPRLDAFRPSPPHGSQEGVTLPAEMTEELAFLLGAYCAEGHIARSTRTVSITNSVEAVLDRVATAWRRVFGVEPVIERREDRCPRVLVASQTIVEFLEHLGCGDRAPSRRIPDVILRSPRPMVLAFLQGLFLDAYVTVTGMPRWGICLDSTALLDDLQAILTNLGIVHSRIGKYNPTYGRTYDEVYATGEHARALVRLVPFCEPEKSFRAELMLARPFDRRRRTSDIVPGLSGRDLYELIPRGESGRYGRSPRRGSAALLDPRTRAVSRAELEAVAAMPGVLLPAWLQTVLDNNLHFSPVVRADEVGDREVFDISVPETHAFVGNGIVNHNTVNMPNEATVEEIRDAYLEGWRLGLKALAIYRDGSKGSQPVSTKSESSKESAATPAALPDVPAAPAPDASAVTGAHAPWTPAEPAHAPAPSAAPAPAPAPAVQPRRERLPHTRRSLTHKFDIQGHEGYINVGFYPDGRPGELFITMAKEGSTIGGLMDVLGTAISIGLQYGVPLEVFVNKFAHSRFEPAGFTKNPDIPIAKSIADYIFRWLGMEFIPGYREANAPKRPAPEPEPTRVMPVLKVNGHRTATIADLEHAEAVLETTSHLPEPSEPHLSTGAVSVDEGLGEQDRQFAHFQSDAPPCDNCGALTVRCGTCYRCFNCGNSMGCS